MPRLSSGVLPSMQGCYTSQVGCRHARALALYGPDHHHLKYICDGPSGVPYPALDWMDDLHGWNGHIHDA